MYVTSSKLNCNMIKRDTCLRVWRILRKNQGRDVSFLVNDPHLFQDTKISIIVYETLGTPKLLPLSFSFFPFCPPTLLFYSVHNCPAGKGCRTLISPIFIALLFSRGCLMNKYNPLNYRECIMRSRYFTIMWLVRTFRFDFCTFRTRSSNVSFSYFFFFWSRSKRTFSQEVSSFNTRTTV